MKINRRIRNYIAIMLCLLLTACSFSPAPAQQTQGTYADTGFLPATPGNYDSVDLAVLVSKNTQTSTLTFYNTEVGRNYTLNYDGATSYADKYGQALSLEQVPLGAMVEVNFMHARKRLDSLMVSPQGFVIEHVRDFAIQPNGRAILLGNESYNLDDGVAVITADGIGELMDINDVDVLRVCGREHTVYGIYVEQGHGYLRLENASYFSEGWIQIGDNIVHQVTNEMLIAVPEGSYTVTVSKRGIVGTEEIVMERGGEVTLDAAVWDTTPHYGRVAFTLTPAEAKVYIDGESVDTGQEIELSYGIHQMVVTADGYETVSRYIRVAEALASLSVVMQPNGSSDNETVSQNSTSENSASENSVSENSTSENAVGIWPWQTSEFGWTASVNAVSENSASDNSVSNNGVSNNSVSNNEAGTTVSQNSSISANSSDVITPGQYRVYIDAPVGVEVYRDGTYIGIAPTSFIKEAGDYVITLRRNGYQTRSYSISVDSEKRDANYSFSDLILIN